MAASTIPNSAGPGSSVELSPVTLAVRDKVIEKFADQPLDQMNESVKALLSNEEDEQKRLGILAARVYILRQRILSIAEADPDRVVTGASPKPQDLAGATAGAGDETETAASEWTRLRILEDCEVNGVRFPKTVIIDVKSADADRLVENGKAELIEESEPAPAVAEAETAAETEVEAAAEAAPEAPVESQADEAAPAAAEAPSEDTAAADDQPEEAAEEAAPDAEETMSEADDPSAMLEALSGESAAQDDVTDDEAADMSATSEQEDSASAEAVIEAPSAAEVTAALEALGAGGPEDADAAGSDIDGSTEDAADVAAELAALSAASTSSDEAEETSEDAAEVAAALEAASAAMAAGPSNTDISDLPAAGAEQDDEDEGGDKTAGWFEAQQNAEKAARGEDSAEGGDNEDNDKS